MSLPPANIAPFEGRSVCLFCGSSDGTDPRYIQAAAEFGKAVAEAGWRFVYGGGGVGLMGASARAAHDAGGRVVGIMPAFLRSRERLFDDVETIVVTSMHERKQLMYDQSDAFVVAPGGIGTLEEILYGPAPVADGTANLIGALRKSMATTGYSDLKEFQRVEVVVAPYSGG